MSFELLEKLESHISNALETLELTQMELEEEKQKSEQLEQRQQALQTENEQLKNELASWNQKIESLLGKLPSTDA
ncbi:MAG: cell division protein ZapB [Ferrimonas sp.]